MTTLYQQLEDIIEKKFPEGGGHYVKWDLNIDKDLVTYDTQKGDLWLWIQKGENGTNLARIRGDAEQESFLKSTYLRELPKNSSIYWLECTGNNEGNVIETTRENVFKRLSSFKDNPNRIPRRQTVYDLLNNYIKDYGQGIHSSVLGKEEGDKTFISIKPEMGTHFRITEVFSGKNKTTEISSHLARYADVKEIGPRYLSVTVGQKTQTGSYGAVDEITEQQFNKIKNLAQKKLEKKQSEPGMSI